MAFSLLKTLNLLRVDKGRTPLSGIWSEYSLRENYQFDSIDIAELTVRLAEAFCGDMFSDALYSLELQNL